MRKIKRNMFRTPAVDIVKADGSTYKLRYVKRSAERRAKGQTLKRWIATQV